jgi:hypothetical protein
MSMERRGEGEDWWEANVNHLPFSAMGTMDANSADQRQQVRCRPFELRQPRRIASHPPVSCWFLLTFVRTRRGA